MKTRIIEILLSHGVSENVACHVYSDLAAVFLVNDGAEMRWKGIKSVIFKSLDWSCEKQKWRWIKCSDIAKELGSNFIGKESFIGEVLSSQNCGSRKSNGSLLRFAPPIKSR